MNVGLSAVESGVSAVASGQGRSDVLVVDFQAGDVDVVVDGERFETNGFSEVYPPDIPVGALAVDADGDIALVPFVDFGTLVYVTVILTVQAP